MMWSIVTFIYLVPSGTRTTVLSTFITLFIKSSVHVSSGEKGADLFYFVKINLSPLFVPFVCGKATSISRHGPVISEVKFDLLFRFGWHAKSIEKSENYRASLDFYFLFSISVSFVVGPSDCKRSSTIFGQRLRDLRLAML